MSSIGIAINLYTVRDAVAEDLIGTLRRVKECGFSFVQWSGVPDLTADEVCAALEQAGLKAIGAHCALEDFEEHLEGAVAYWARIGVPDITIGGMPVELRHNAEAWIAGCRRLDEVGAQLRARGMRLSYHTHGHELQALSPGGETRLECLMRLTRPENLSLEPDSGWLMACGAQPEDILRAYADRCPLLQVQECLLTDPPCFGPLGTGLVDWNALFDAGEEAAVEWYIYRQETHTGGLFDDLRRSYRFLEERA